MVRTGWILAGHGFLALGVVGAVLPLLPTTVFVLAAAACYARGSERFYNMLLEHRVFGPMVHDWREHRAMSLKAKRWAIAAIVVTISISIALVDHTAVRIGLGVVALALIVGLLRVRTRVESKED